MWFSPHSRISVFQDDVVYFGRQVICMASFYSVETPVHVSAYDRFRFNKWEHVCKHWRRLPHR